MCRDALAVGAGVGAVPTVVGPGSLKRSSNNHIPTSPKVTSDAVMPSVEPAR
jgi:hypothetical protein